ncbi:hypothetical protein HMSSN139_36350 [Paenibacillus sp. HMSSN-139]|nr:hypothetical protein HMSSN139_36350 [Paenibacillus sp. HMSSN-139]
MEVNGVFQLMGHIVEEVLPLPVQMLEAIAIPFDSNDLLLDLPDHFVEVRSQPADFVPPCPFDVDVDVEIPVHHFVGSFAKLDQWNGNIAGQDIRKQECRRENRQRQIGDRIQNRAGLLVQQSEVFGEPQNPHFGSVDHDRI